MLRTRLRVICRHALGCASCGAAPSPCPAAPARLGYGGGLVVEDAVDHVVVLLRPELRVFEIVFFFLHSKYLLCFFDFGPTWPEVIFACPCLFPNVSFFSAKLGWDGKSYYPPCFRPRKAPVYKGFSGPKCPHAALCRRIYSRCRLRFATSLQVPEQKARLPCRGNSLPQTAQARSSALWPGPDKARASSGARGKTASRK